ncbi:MAG TPA: hypothetical protein VEY30_09905 [Myxococcaceae bacterium]|nr:hypothetical protein [Myxococcaceae bacterium]
MRLKFINRGVRLALLLSGVVAWAQEARTLPVDVQVRLLKSVFSYDYTLKDAGPVSVFVVSPGAPSRQAVDMAEALTRGGVKSKTATPQEAAAAPGKTSVLYVMPEASAVARSLCARPGLLCVSGTPALAESGTVGVAVGLKADSRPEIIVHPRRVKDEGHELSSSLLSLARLIP